MSLQIFQMIILKIELIQNLILHYKLELSFKFVIINIKINFNYSCKWLYSRNWKFNKLFLRYINKWRRFFIWILSTLKRANPNLICSDKKMVYYIIIYHLGLIVVVIIVIMNSNIEFIKIINIILLMFIPLQIKLKVEFGYRWFIGWISFVVHFVLLFFI